MEECGVCKKKMGTLSPGATVVIEDKRLLLCKNCLAAYTQMQKTGNSSVSEQEIRNSISSKLASSKRKNPKIKYDNTGPPIPPPPLRNRLLPLMAPIVFFAILPFSSFFLSICGRV